MVRWIKLENIKCPVCPSPRKLDWYCKIHGDPMWINELGILECQSGYCTGKVIQWRWRWNCESYCRGVLTINHDKGFEPADVEGFTFALTQAVSLMAIAGNDWVASLVMNLGQQYECDRIWKYYNWIFKHT